MIVGPAAVMASQLKKLLEPYDIEVVWHRGAGGLHREPALDGIILNTEDLVDGTAAIRRVTACHLIVVGDERYASTCLSMGADAWLPQGVGLNVIAAQARAALKAPTRERAFAIIQAGRLRMDVAGRRVHLDDREVPLKPREFELLKVLLDNQGTALSRERILAGAWGTRFVGEPKTVDVHMAWLRPKLDGSGVRVTTLRGVGYRLDVLDRGEGLTLPHPAAQAEPLPLRLP